MAGHNYTYILVCSDSTFYTGWTNNIQARIKKHNEKKGAKYTKTRTPVKLVYLEVHQTKQEAMRREFAIKKLNRRQKDKLIKETSLKEIFTKYEIGMDEVKNMKRYDKIHKLTDNPFLNLYQLDARTKSGNSFQYYFASRNPEDKIKINTHGLNPEGIVIYAVTQEPPHRVVLIRQYRYPMDDYIYELPAGLVDPGETPSEAAIREMKEETGYNLIAYNGGEACMRRPFFLAQGLTDETSTAIYGSVSEKECQNALEDSEDIEVILADKEMVREILKNERVSSRAAFLLVSFLRSKDEDPFEFLEL